MSSFAKGRPLHAVAGCLCALASISVAGLAQAQDGPPPEGPPPPGPGPETPFEARTIDGTGNNLERPLWGSTGTPLVRLPGLAAYADELGTMIDRGNTRAISNTIGAQSEEGLGNADGVSAMFWVWGQFVDHDITLVHTGAEFEPVFAPADDEWFVPGAMIPFTRADYAGDDDGRVYLNDLTQWLDGSMVYGSTEDRAIALRAFEGGRLDTTPGNFMPYNLGSWENANDSGIFEDYDLFLAGDIRANESTPLTAMHTIWVREHNRWARRLERDHPQWNDERIYQVARKVVGAEIQRITYEDWLPILIGEALPQYEGYQPDANPAMNTTFSGAAFRFGHTMVNGDLVRIDENGQPFDDGGLTLAQAFFDPTTVTDPGALSAILRGLAWQEANAVDTQVVDDLRNLLFGFPGAGGLDLLTLNLSRGRDMGVPSYNRVRGFFGLPPAQEFRDITRDREQGRALADAYGTPQNVDPWAGMFAEDPAPGALVGPTATRVIAEQFARLRDGDRFFYRNDPALNPYREAIRDTTLAEVIKRNTSIDRLQPDIFRAGEAGPPSCGPADLAAPFGQMNVFDLIAFLRAYSAGAPAADLAAPQGAPDVIDLIAFLSMFNHGCP